MSFNVQYNFIAVDKFTAVTKKIAKVNEKIQQYAKEFVICNECAKPDTEIISDKGVKFKHCLACGAKHPIKSKI